MEDRRYWLLKSEPDCYSIEDLERDRVTYWDGVRNYQARNFMRDDMKPGDLAFFYHSSTEPAGIVGIAEVVREGYPDHTQFDPEADHFDSGASQDDPRWFMVDISFRKRLDSTLTLKDLKQIPGLEKMAVTQKGSRLSVQPVTTEEWEVILSHLGDPVNAAQEN